MSQKLLPLNPRQMVGLADGNSFWRIGHFGC